MNPRHGAGVPHLDRVRVPHPRRHTARVGPADLLDPAPTWGVAAIQDAAFGGTPWVNIAICLGLSAVYGVIGALLAGRLVNAARTHATLALT